MAKLWVSDTCVIGWAYPEVAITPGASVKRASDPERISGW